MSTARLLAVWALIWVPAFLPDPAASQINHQEQADAHAMITERWEHYEREIGLIDMGYHCSLYPEFATRVAVMVLRNQMEREKLRTAARLDDTLKSADYISRGIAEGKAAAKNGECDRLSTEAQARLRALVADLVNLAADQ